MPPPSRQGRTQAPPCCGLGRLRSGRLRSGRLLALLLGALLAGGLLSPAAQAKAAKPGPTFVRFSAAWEKRATVTLVGCMDPKGTVLIKLLSYPLSGKVRSMKPEQAKASLKTYFKKLSGVKLKNVTPKKSPKKVRLYDYTYKPEGENARTTRLHVQLKQDKNNLWVLASVTESVKPRE